MRIESVTVLAAMASALAMAGAVLAEDSLPLLSVNKASEVIDAAVEAHGGAEALSNLNTIIQETRFVTYANDQSRGTAPPWDQNEQNNFNAVDFTNEFIYTSGSGSGGGFEFSFATIVNGSDSWQIDYRGGTAAPIATPDFIATAGPFIRVTPALIMKQLMARRQFSHWLGEVTVDGKAHDIVTLVMETGPGLSLYIDKETHMLTRMERVLAPFGQIEYLFGDYAEIDGIPFNRSFYLKANGQPNIDSTIINTQLNVPVESYAAVPEGLEQVAQQTPDDFNLQEIDEGVFLVGGNGAYGLFVEMDDYILAIGGTQGVAARFEEVEKHISNKPLRYGVLTHHHNDHTPGAAEYAAAGATIVAAQAHAAVVRAASGEDEGKFEWVDESMSFKSGSRVVELYDIGPTPHAEHLLIAWLPREKIIFEADHFPLPRNGSIPPAVPATRALAASIDRLKLDYQRIVGAHSSRIGDRDVMEQALIKLPANREDHNSSAP